MIKELFTSFGENIKNKTTNPFFGTLIIVWLIHSWRFIYTIFNFPANVTLENKILFIAGYLEPTHFLPSLALCILISFVVLILSYCSLSLARLIINFFEKVVTPYVYKLTDRSSIVLKEDYDVLKEEKNGVLQKYENEREVRLKLQNDRDQLEAKYIQLTSENAKLLSQDIQNKSEVHTQSTNQVFDKIASIVKSIEEHKLLQDFDEVIELIGNKEKIYTNSDGIRYFAKIGLVEKQTQIDNSHASFVLTELGSKVKTYYLENHLFNKTNENR